MAQYFVLVVLLVPTLRVVKVQSQVTYDVQCGPIDTDCGCGGGTDICRLQFYENAQYYIYMYAGRMRLVVQYRWHVCVFGVGE